MVELTNKIENYDIPSPDKVSYMPESLLKFHPQDEDTFIRTSKGEFQRILFTDQPLLEIEQKHWDGFLKYLSENGVSVPSNYLNHERYLLRYLQAAKWDYKVAYEAVT